jgi:hypothetical protein
MAICGVWMTRLSPLPEAVAAADSVTVVALLTAAIVVSARIPAPEIRFPTSALVNWAVAELTLVDAFVTTPSITLRDGR